MCTQQLQQKQRRRRIVSGSLHTDRLESRSEASTEGARDSLLSMRWCQQRWATSQHSPARPQAMQYVNGRPTPLASCGRSVHDPREIISVGREVSADGWSVPPLLCGLDVPRYTRRRQEGEKCANVAKVTMVACFARPAAACCVYQWPHPGSKSHRQLHDSSMASPACLCGCGAFPLRYCSSSTL